MTKQHKWHKEIKAWADGEIIEVYYKGVLDNVLTVNDMPNWINEDLTFRIKPQPKEPQYLYVYEGLLSTVSNTRGIWLEKQKVDYIERGYIGKIKLEQDDAD
jgi:TusA-related sulfurtransferase